MMKRFLVTWLITCLFTYSVSQLISIADLNCDAYDGKLFRICKLLAIDLPIIL